MQQEKQQRPIVAGVRKVEIGGIHRQQSRRRAAWQLAAQVFQLHRQDVDDIQSAAAGRNPADQLAGQITVDARDLQGGAGKDIAQFRHRRIAQPRIIAPQDEIDQPLPLEKPYRPGVHISPPVMRGEIMRRLDPKSGQGFDD